MAEPSKEKGGPDATFVVAEKQAGDKSWPVPGDEGYVHPDGTPESFRQLENNQLAQADRDALGAVVHGAPLATPGPQAADITAAKVANASKNDNAPATGELAREQNDKIPNPADRLPQ